MPEIEVKPAEVEVVKVKESDKPAEVIDKVAENLEEKIDKDNENENLSNDKLDRVIEGLQTLNENVSSLCTVMEGMANKSVEVVKEEIKEEKPEEETIEVKEEVKEEPKKRNRHFI